MRASALPAVLLCGLALPAAAAPPDAWKDKMNDVDRLLKEEQWARADEVGVELLATIVSRVEGGPGEAAFVALPMVQVAVARAGQGDRIGAEWWWWGAQQVLPDMAHLDLTPYGDVGAAVRDLGAPPRAADLPPVERDPVAPFLWHSSEGFAAQCSFQRPGAAPPNEQMRVTVGRKPVVPGKAPKDPAVVEVRVVVDSSGRLTRPIIVPPQPSPTHVAGALLSLETWRSVILGNEPVDGFAQVAFASVQGSERSPDRPTMSAGAADKRSERVIALLREGQPKDALKEAQLLLTDMLEGGFGRADQEAPLARALVLRARAAELAGDSHLAAASFAEAKLLSSEVSGATLLELDAPEPKAPAPEAREISKDATAAGLVPPMLLQRVEPNYPHSAKRARVSGEVVMRTIIDQDGRVLLERLIASPDPVLAVTTMESVRQWRYKPAQMSGRPQAVYLVVRVKFNLG